MSEKSICIIPARGGSKRLKRKNILQFSGRPIIAWTIEAAQKSGLFERIVVSTEDSEIAEVASKFGAEIAQRSDALATDEARVLDVCLDLLEQEKRAGRQYDIMCTLYATAPLRNEDDIRATYNLVQSGDADFALAVTDYPLPPHQALITNEHGMTVPMWPDLVNMKSNDVPEMYVDNGSTYVVRVADFIREKSYYGPRLKGYAMPRERSVDIDTQDDFDLAEYYSKRINL